MINTRNVVTKIFNITKKKYTHRKMQYQCSDNSNGKFSTGLIEEFVEVVAPMSPKVVDPVTPEAPVTLQVTVTAKAPVIHEKPRNREECKVSVNPPQVDLLEEDMCRKFNQQACGCYKVPGKRQCSNRFPLEQYLDL